ncbi:hypothetical protein EJD21_00530 [Salmonella enterica subsp. enterica serovar Leatherhead]|nr:hypothetical protein [Salmonella enterica subsp. enterica serovar Leatherhead]
MTGVSERSQHISDLKYEGYISLVNRHTFYAGWRLMPYPAYKSTLPVGRISDVSIAIRHFSSLVASPHHHNIC